MGQEKVPTSHTQVCSDRDMRVWPPSDSTSSSPARPRASLIASSSRWGILWSPDLNYQSFYRFGSIKQANIGDLTICYVQYPQSKYVPRLTGWVTSRVKFTSTIPGGKWSSGTDTGTTSLLTRATGPRRPRRPPTPWRGPPGWRSLPQTAP